MENEERVSKGREFHCLNLGFLGFRILSISTRVELTMGISEFICPLSFPRAENDLKKVVDVVVAPIFE